MIHEKTMSVFVKSIHQETPLVKEFTLAPAGDQPLPPFIGGSHISTYLEGSNGLLIRQYSLICSPDHSETYRIAVRLSDSSKGGSLYWHKRIKEGDQLRISYPRNHFPLSFSAKHHVFYAAGIGITPFLSMMEELKGEGKSFELHYASKTKKTCAFYSYLIKRYPDETHFYFSQEKEAQRVNETSLLKHKIGTHVYVCGPESFITMFTDAALRFGYPKSSIHSERFTAPQPSSSEPFKVQLKDGTLLEVKKEDTLLEVLLNKGLAAPHSCQVGRCGTCELEVIEGEIEHYDSFLSEEERKAQNKMLTCVSRGKSNKLLLNF
jgi:dimethylamine monooxygenase subunit B